MRRITAAGLQESVTWGVPSISYRHSTLLLCRHASPRLLCCVCHVCRAALRELVSEAEYFLGILPDGSGLAAPLKFGQRAPMQLGRQILAQLAGVPERADWKACTAGTCAPP
jgi:hypothetical protein